MGEGGEVEGDVRGGGGDGVEGVECGGNAIVAIRPPLRGGEHVEPVQRGGEEAEEKDEAASADAGGGGAPQAMAVAKDVWSHVGNGGGVGEGGIGEGKGENNYEEARGKGVYAGRLRVLPLVLP